MTHEHGINHMYIMVTELCSNEVAEYLNLWGAVYLAWVKSRVTMNIIK